ncbi:MAG: family 2 glycosyl transferase [Verrucomicrobiales bacterium]|nr:family 2 glycosyl transferase [Verrucomicrobiales bacterium]
MNKLHKLTVVLPTYNRRVLLERALSSVLAQCRGDKRICIHVWDNNSSDDTESYMQDLVKNESAIYYTRRSENIGAITNYTDAIAKVETEFYVGLADDDYLLGDFLQESISLLEGDRTLGAVAMQTLHVSGTGEVTKINPDDRWRNGRYEPPETMEYWSRLGHFEWSSIVFRKAAYDAAGGLNSRYGLASDVAYQMNVFLHWPIFISKKPAAVYNIHDGQQSANLGIWYFKAALLMVEDFKKAARSRPEFETSLRLLTRRYAETFSKLGSVAGSLRDLACLIRGIIWSFGSPGCAGLCLLRGGAAKAGLKRRLPHAGRQAQGSSLGMISDYAPDSLSKV